MNVLNLYNSFIIDLMVMIYIQMIIAVVTKLISIINDERGNFCLKKLH